MLLPALFIDLKTQPQNEIKEPVPTGTGSRFVLFEQGRGPYFARTFFKRAKRGRPFSFTISVSPWIRGRQ